MNTLISYEYLDDSEESRDYVSSRGGLKAKFLVSWSHFGFTNQCLGCQLMEIELLL